MIWLAIGMAVYAVLGLLFVVALCHAASWADDAGEQMALELRPNLTEASRDRARSAA